MNPNTAMPIPVDAESDNREQSADDILRERERIRESYLTIADCLRSEYARVTAARTPKRIKQLYARAVKDKVVDANPFDGIRPDFNTSRPRTP